MVKKTRDMRGWVTGMIGPVPAGPAAGMPHLKLDDELGICSDCGKKRLAEELRQLGGHCAECSELY